MSGYLYFKKTGSDKIDAILDALEQAGALFHNTSEWGDDCEFNEGGKSCVDLIQGAANDAAKSITE